MEQGELDELIEAQAAWRNRANTIKAEKPKIETAGVKQWGIGMMCNLDLTGSQWALITRICLSASKS